MKKTAQCPSYCDLSASGLLCTSISHCHKSSSFVTGLFPSSRIGAPASCHVFTILPVTPKTSPIAAQPRTKSSIILCWLEFVCHLFAQFPYFRLFFRQVVNLRLYRFLSFLYTRFHFLITDNHVLPF